MPKRQELLRLVRQRREDPIIAGFIEVAGPIYDRERADIYDRQGAGNEVATRIGELGNLWTPDISALFQIYLSLFEEATNQRLDWIDMAIGSPQGAMAIEMPSVVPAYAGALTANWQIAWAASRAPLGDVLRLISPATESPLPKVRWAAAQFLQEVAKYRRVEYPPVFGRVRGPRTRSYRDVEGITLDDFVSHVPALEREVSAKSPGFSVAPVDPNARYADVLFIATKITFLPSRWRIPPHSKRLAGTGLRSLSDKRQSGSKRKRKPHGSPSGRCTKRYPSRCW